MRQLVALAWKEWHEVRIYLWIALGVFIGLPLIGVLEAMYQHTGHHFEIEISPWVIIFGGVLAVFVAVGATCRDLNGRLEDFWRSRPLNVGQWLAVKYLVGLFVVLASCLIPLAVELWFDKSKQSLPLAVWFPFMWATAYSIGFLSGCLLRRTAHAAMLALAGMLLVWFLPLVLPPLQWMSAGAMFDYFPSDHWPEIFDAKYVQFAAGMAGITVVMLIISIQAAHRGWHIEAGSKMMYGSVSAALLILFASAAFQLGTNLPILQQIDFPPIGFALRNGVSTTIHCEGRHGFILTEYLPLEPELQLAHPRIALRTFDLSDSGLSLTGTVKDCTFSPVWRQIGFAWAPGRLDIQYVLLAEARPVGKCAQMLDVFSLGGGTNEPPQFLWEGNWPPGVQIMPTLYIKKDRLYAVDDGHLAVLDISDPLKPKIISNGPLLWSGITFYPEYQDVEKLIYNLPPVPELSAAERLEVAMKFASSLGNPSFDGEFLCFADGGDLVAYRLVSLNANTATFKKIGQYEPTILQSVYGVNGYEGLTMQNGLVYVQTYARNSIFNSSISVFDLRSQPPLRMIGHFAAPGVEVVQPLLDGRAIVGGSKLWLVGPPKGRSMDHSTGN